MSSKRPWFGTEANGPAEKTRRASMGPIRTNGLSRRRVGFIGLDPIAQAMASRLLEAGHQLMLYDPARVIPEALQSAGGRVASSVWDACRWADAVFTMLADDEATEAVLLGPGGVVESLPRSGIHIGSSSVSVECSDRIVEAHWDAGKEYVSAPVLVISDRPAEERLALIAGGSRATIIQIEKLLRLIGQVTKLEGWPSDANLVQLRANASGAQAAHFLNRHAELRAPPDRGQVAGLAFREIETNQNHV